MYVPSSFRVTDGELIRGFAREHAFATLISTADDAPCATHLPFLVDGDATSMTLRAHMARANGQWRHLTERESLVIFLGPHAYVSPRWYETRDNVPTWDYMAVHAYGRARIVDTPAGVLDILERLSARYEAGTKDPWRMDDLNPTKREGFIRAIVAFEIPVSRVEASYKLSQNRSITERRRVAAELLRGGFTSIAQAIERS